MSSIVRDRVTAVEEFENKVQARTARVGIIGLGYVGLPLALLFNEEKFPVTGFDIDATKVDTLNAGGSYICRIPPTEIQLAQQRHFSVTTHFAQLRDMDAIIICVPTPLDEYHQPDMSYITSTAESIAPYLRPEQLIVLESTTYPGTTEEVLLPILESGNRAGLKAVRRGQSGDFYLAFSPEREDPGNQTVARRDIPKVVGGAGSGRVGVGGGAVWFDIQPGCSRLKPSGRRNDQAAGKHISLREHRVGE